MGNSESSENEKPGNGGGGKLVMESGGGRQSTFKYRESINHRTGESQRDVYIQADRVYADGGGGQSFSNALSGSQNCGNQKQLK